MQTVQLVLLLLAVVALAAAAPTPDSHQYEDYDYGSYEDEDDSDSYRLPSSMFEDLRPHGVKEDSPQQSACSWAVVQCCSVPERMGSRARCFDRLGCSGSWFSDICTPDIQRSVLKGILGFHTGH